MSQSLTQQRLRICFGQDGPLRFVGHLDLARTWERILRRAQTPLEYSQGFTPRPRMQFAAALPIGVSSECEYLDIWLTARLDEPPLPAWRERLQATSPRGLTVLAIEEVPIKGLALPTLVTHAKYRITPVDSTLTRDRLAARVEALLAAERIERVRSNGKPYDLRPLILDLTVDDSGALAADLVAGDEGAGRADELVKALDLELSQIRAHRTRLFLREDSAE